MCAHSCARGQEAIGGAGTIEATGPAGEGAGVAPLVAGTGAATTSDDGAGVLSGPWSTISGTEAATTSDDGTGVLSSTWSPTAGPAGHGHPNCWNGSRHNFGRWGRRRTHRAKYRLVCTRANRRDRKLGLLWSGASRRLRKLGQGKVTATEDCCLRLCYRAPQTANGGTGCWVRPGVGSFFCYPTWPWECHFLHNVPSGTLLHDLHRRVLHCRTLRARPKIVATYCLFQQIEFKQVHFVFSHCFFLVQTANA